MMTPREIDKLVAEYIGTNGGYLNHFSYSIHDQFYSHYCDLDIDVSAYRAKGLTTRKAFIKILKDSKPRDQAKISKYPPAKPVALFCEPLKAANRGR
jgi:hypothetical protein